jgi:hypothetical protein
MNDYSESDFYGEWINTAGDVWIISADAIEY